MKKNKRRKKQKTNCLVYAKNKMDKKGGYIAFRWTRWNKFRFLKWPHFFWMPDICPDKKEPCPHFRSYVPKSKKKVCVLPPLFFHGKITKGDGDKGPDKKM